MYQPERPDAERIFADERPRLIGLAYRPVRVIPFAIVLALIATAMGGRHARLAAAAVFVGGLCFIVGLALAVITNNPIF